MRSGGNDAVVGENGERAIDDFSQPGAIEWERALYPRRGAVGANFDPQRAARPASDAIKREVVTIVERLANAKKLFDARIGIDAIGRERAQIERQIEEFSVAGIKFRQKSVERRGAVVERTEHRGGLR